MPLDRMGPGEAVAQARQLYVQLQADAARLPPLHTLLQTATAG